MTIPFNIPFPGIVAVASRNDNGKIEMYGMKECKYDGISVIEASEHLIFDFSSNSSCAKIWIAKATQNEIKVNWGTNFTVMCDKSKGRLPYFMGTFQAHAHIQIGTICLMNCSQKR